MRTAGAWGGSECGWSSQQLGQQAVRCGMALVEEEGVGVGLTVLVKKEFKNDCQICKNVIIKDVHLVETF